MKHLKVKSTFILIGFKAIKELGLRQVSLFGLYQMGKRLGHWKRRVQPPSGPRVPICWDVLRVPAINGFLQKTELDVARITEEANEILVGRVRLFGGFPVPLELDPGVGLENWTVYDIGEYRDRDIKWTWEPARFGWALTLARAWYMTGDVRYVNGFIGFTEKFLKANPPYKGPNWVSGQEVGIRLVNLCFAARILSSPSLDGKKPVIATDFLETLAEAIVIHTARIPPTLLYARAQNNNHLLTEAMALYTAGVLMPGHPDSGYWRDLGWRWFNKGVCSQIDPDGTYMQQSTNYHRLMLQTALWMNFLGQSQGHFFHQDTQTKVAAATRWLLTLVDPTTGCVPNLGANDGAYLFPLSSTAYEDFRPVVQAASKAFLEKPSFPSGIWDEMGMWFGLEKDSSDPLKRPDVQNILLHPDLNGTWGYLRTAKFKHRPGHADQLHLDLWWKGHNIAKDPGTYLYNGAFPWQNPFAPAFYHNTVTIDEQDQMTSAGKFLYLDRSEGFILDKTDSKCVGIHNGYHKLGIKHRRELTGTPNGWQVIDDITKISYQSKDLNRHLMQWIWILPDWQYQLNDNKLIIDSPEGTIELSYNLVSEDGRINTDLYREGKCVYGLGSESVCRGWVAPTYGYKTPALMLMLNVESKLPVRLTTTWVLPSGGQFKS